jgi:hypothetical protein
MQPARPVEWEVAGAQSPAPGPIGVSEGRVMDFTPPPAAAFKRLGLKPFGFFCVRDSMSLSVTA